MARKRKSAKSLRKEMKRRMASVPTIDDALLQKIKDKEPTEEEAAVLAEQIEKGLAACREQHAKAKRDSQKFTNDAVDRRGSCGAVGFVSLESFEE